MLLHRKQQPRLSRLPSSPFTRTFFGTSVPWDAQPIGHRQPSVGASGSAPNPFLKQAREAGSGFSGAGSYKSVSRNIDAVGDSATETGDRLYCSGFFYLGANKEGSMSIINMNLPDASG